MKWAFVIIGLLLLIIGLQSYLSNWGLPSSLADIFRILPVEGAGYRVVVMIVGALAFILGIRTSRN